MKKQYLLSIGAVVLILVLYFGFTNKPPKESAYDILSKKLIDSLQVQGEDSIILLQKQLKKNSSEKSNTLTLLASAWTRAGEPAIAADYTRQLADAQPSYERYMQAGNNFLQLIPIEARENIRVNVVYGARYCFEEAMQLKPGDLDAKINLASVLVQGTNSPMDGIMMLRDIDEKNPGNVKVNMQLGQFAIMSGQYDKAIGRFTTVLHSDSLNVQSQYYLAQAYLGMQDTASAIIHLEQSTHLEQDTLVRNQVLKEIANLKH